MIQLVPVVLARLNLVIGDKKGVTAVEYGLLAALIVIAAATAIGTVGTTLSGVFTTLNTKL